MLIYDVLFVENCFIIEATWNATCVMFTLISNDLDALFAIKLLNERVHYGSIWIVYIGKRTNKTHIIVAWISFKSLTLCIFFSRKLWRVFCVLWRKQIWKDFCGSDQGIELSNMWKGIQKSSKLSSSFQYKTFSRETL